MRKLSGSFSVFFLILIFAIPSVNALTLSADLGDISSSPNNLSLAIPTGTSPIDANSYFIEFEDNKYLTLTGMSSIEFNITIEWTGDDGLTSFKTDFGLTLIDEFGNSIGSYTGGGGGSAGIIWTETMSFSNVNSAVNIHAFEWLPGLDVEARYAGFNVVEGTLDIDLSGVDGIVGSPVPEPTTMLLFGIGLLGVAGINRRKK